jgi:hypothetical protein
MELPPCDCVQRRAWDDLWLMVEEEPRAPSKDSFWAISISIDGMNTFQTTSLSSV